MTESVRSERRRRRGRDNLELIVSIVAICLMIYMVYLTVHVDHKEEALNKKFGGAHTQLVDACVRLNILRAEDNVSHLADYKIYKVFYTLTLQSEIRNPPKTSEQRKEFHEFIVPVKESLATKSWTPLTNCVQAVNRQGVHYKPPAPVAFEKALPPVYDLYPPANSTALR